jgi:hypothetical protein
MPGTDATDSNFKHLQTFYDTQFWYYLQHNTKSDLLKIIQCAGAEEMTS